MVFSIYRQVQKEGNWHQNWSAIIASFTGPKAWRLYVVLLLMLTNWGIEAKKWQILLRHMVIMPFSTAFKSVLSGVTFTMITPNRMGEFIGRVFYVHEGERLRAATLTIVGSVSQIIATLSAGAIALFVLKQNIITAQKVGSLSLFWVNGLFIGTIIILVTITLFYFKISWLASLAEKIPALQKIIYFISLLKEVQATELLKILSLSTLRYLVFISQYMLVFGLFGVAMPLWQGCCAVGILFLVLAAIPLPGIAELGVRAKASVALFGLFSSNIFGITVCTGTIWLINIILPAVLGSLLILNVKIFNKNDSFE